MAKVKNPELSIVILNYNVRDLLLRCLKSVLRDSNSKKWQVIVVDNASKDDSASSVKEEFPNIELIENKDNLGFAAGNNVAVPNLKASVVLFLNPDTEIIGNAISDSLVYLNSNPDIGALTCRVELPDGRLDYSCHRGFPTPWNSFSYFSGLSKLFPRSSFFSKYTATHLDLNKIHEIDCLTGAFLMVRKIAGDQIKWWDKDYFWNGEDIEFCFKLKEKGWKIYFYPEVKIIHYKGSSAKQDRESRLLTTKHGISAMRIFYLKHYYKNYPPILKDLVLWGIKALEHYRSCIATLT